MGRVMDQRWMYGLEREWEDGQGTGYDTEDYDTTWHLKFLRRYEHEP